MVVLFFFFLFFLVLLSWELEKFLRFIILGTFDREGIAMSPSMRNLSENPCRYGATWVRRADTSGMVRVANENEVKTVV